MNYFSVLIMLLRDRANFLSEIRQNIKIEQKIIALLVSSSIFFAVYGLIIGASNSWLQSASSAIKLPALYLITLVICLPTLYFFDILMGSSLQFAQYLALMLTTVSVISVLLFAFAPVTLFFLISIRDYNFFLFINLVIFSITGLVGVSLFYQAMQTVVRPAVLKVRDADPRDPEPSHQDMRQRLLKGWLVLYALVGSQLGWTLRPFFGAPDQAFQLFRPEIEGNFYQQVIIIVLKLFGW